MASDTFRNLAIGFMLFGLITVLTITVVYEMGSNYGVSAERLNEATAGALDTEEYEAELLESDTTTENFRQRFEEGDVDNVDDPSGLFSVSGDIIGVITTPFNLLAKVMENIMGVPTIVTHVILGILNLSLILGIWRVLRAGD